MNSRRWMMFIVLSLIVGGVVIPRIKPRKSLHAKAAEEMEQIGIALDRYAKDNGDYPSTEQGLTGLWEFPEGHPIPIGWNGPYLKFPTKRDIWGNEYFYRHPGLHDRLAYDLISFGSDGKEGGHGEAHDIASWTQN